MIRKHCHRCGKVMPANHRHRPPNTRPSPRARGYDREWERTRRTYLSAFPICQWPEGCIRPATDVHHLDGRGPKGPKGHDFGNLLGYCHSHHSQETAQAQPGGWNSPGYEGR